MCPTELIQPYSASFPMSSQPGPFLTLDGRKSAHKGIIYYTIGQHKKLGLPQPDGPLYVIAIDPKKNAVIVGPSQALFRRDAAVKEANWISGKVLTHLLPALSRSVIDRKRSRPSSPRPDPIPSPSFLTSPSAPLHQGSPLSSMALVMKQTSL